MYLGASIPEIVEKCDRFNPFPGVFAKYHGKREGDPVKKECEEQKKSSLRCHARLCGGGDLLKALGIVASYLAERSFNLSNDIHGLCHLLGILARFCQ